MSQLDLSNIRSDDHLLMARGEAYLAENPDPGVRIRPPGEIQHAQSTGMGVVVTRGADICALSLIYQFDIPPDGPVYSEIGTMRVTENGLGLQVFIAKFHLLQLWIEEYTDAVPLTFAVVSPGTRSAKNLITHVGMNFWAPTQELTVIRQTRGVPFDPQKHVLLASQTAFSSARADLKALHLGGRDFRTPIGDGVVHVSMAWFNPQVLD